MKTGTFSFYMEGAAKDGDFKGYAKPLLDKVVDVGQDQGKFKHRREFAKAASSSNLSAM